MRSFWLPVHRYAGLAMAVFLLVAGLTGSIIAFDQELDAWLNPGLSRAHASGPSLPIDELVSRVERAAPNLRISNIRLGAPAGRSIEMFGDARIDPATGRPFGAIADNLFVDPVSGEILGRRLWGECCLARPQLIPFLYRLHYSLHLPGTIGLWLMGIVSLVWALDCFIGAYLTFPRKRPVWARWKNAWRVKIDAGGQRLNYDLHRAGGLWPWLILLAVAVSGVALNLGNELFKPVVSMFSPVTPSIFDRLPAKDTQIEPVVSFGGILERAHTEAARRQLPQRFSSVGYVAANGIYVVNLGHDNPAGLGNPALYFDARDGRVIDAALPGTGTAGDVFMDLQFPLHTGQVAGLPGRIFICVLGLVISILSVTGVIIWLKKRRTRESRPADAALRTSAASR